MGERKRWERRGGEEISLEQQDRQNGGIEARREETRREERRRVSDK